MAPTAIIPSSPTHLGFFALSRIHQEAHCLIGRFGLTAQDLDDIKQEITLRVLKELRRHDPSRASCDTFIDRVVRHCATDLVRYYGAHQRNSQGRLRSIDAGSSSEEAGATRFADPTSGEAIRQSDMRDDIATLLEGLSADDRLIAEALRHDSISTVAKALGVHRDHVYASMQRIRERAIAIGLQPSA